MALNRQNMTPILKEGYRSNWAEKIGRRTFHAGKQKGDFNQSETGLCAHVWPWWGKTGREIKIKHMEDLTWILYCTLVAMVSLRPSEFNPKAGSRTLRRTLGQEHCRQMGSFYYDESEFAVKVQSLPACFLPPSPRSALAFCHGSDGRCQHLDCGLPSLQNYIFSVPGLWNSVTAIWNGLRHLFFLNFVSKGFKI